jgi:hypothetical protein
MNDIDFTDKQLDGLDCTDLNYEQVNRIHEQVSHILKRHTSTISTTVKEAQLEELNDAGEIHHSIYDYRTEEGE